jgi:hypothetical protein
MAKGRCSDSSLIIGIQQNGLLEKNFCFFEKGNHTIENSIRKKLLNECCILVELSDFILDFGQIEKTNWYLTRIPDCQSVKMIVDMILIQSL